MTLVDSGDPRLPSVSLYCPPGLTVQQCLQFERVMEHLHRSDHYICNQTAGIIDDQIYNHGNGDQGVYYMPQPIHHPNRAGGSQYNESSQQFYNYTVVFPRGYESDHELVLTLTHEAYGHQALNNHDEFLAELAAAMCDIEN